MKGITIIFFTLFLFLLSSCKKYEEGPVLSLRSKKSRLIGTWTLKSQSENGVGTLLFSIDKLEIKKDGTFKFSFKRTVSDPSEGSWSFTSDKENVDFKFTCCSNRYKILKLKNRELWLENSVYFTNTNSIVTEYHFEQ